MTCIVPTCNGTSGYFRRFPGKTVLSERWLDSIRKGCGMETNLLLGDDDLRNECQICVWHFETPASGNPLMEPRKFLDTNGHQMEIDSCRLCLELFPTGQMVDANGKLGGAKIKSMISESVEADFDWDVDQTLICTGCLVRLDLLTAIKNDFLNAALKLHHLLDLVQQEPIQKVEVDDEHVMVFKVEEAHHEEIPQKQGHAQEYEDHLRQLLAQEESDDEEEASDSDEWIPPVELEPDITMKTGKKPRGLSTENSDLKPKLRDIIWRKCYICPELLADNSTLAAHLAERHASTDYKKCAECSRQFFSLPAYNRHLSRHDESERPHKCSSCPLRFATTSKRILHMKTIHDPKHVAAKDDEISLGDSKVLECKLCGHKAPQHKLRTHIETTHANEIYPYRKCAECPLLFLTYRAWYSHSAVHTDKFACKECGARFSASHLLRDHMEVTHPDGTSWECSLCPGKQFKTSRLLKIHTSRSHSGVKPHECEICQKRFSRKDAMDMHRRIHTGEKHFECEKCSTQFPNRSAAYKHTKRCGGDLKKIS